MIIFKGESIRNKGVNREAGRYIGRVISFEPTAYKDGESIFVNLPNGCLGSALDDGQSIESELSSATDRLLSSGWHASYEAAQAAADFEVAERSAGRLKFG